MESTFLILNCIKYTKNSTIIIEFNSPKGAKEITDPPVRFLTCKRSNINDFVLFHQEMQVPT